MKKTLLVSALATLFLAACGGSGSQSAEQKTAAPSAAAEKQAATDKLNIYIWSDYVDPATLEAFKKDNKLDVRYDNYDSNETLEAKVLTGKAGFDLVVPSIANVARQIKAGAYQKVDKNQIPNYKNIDPDLLKLM